MSSTTTVNLNPCVSCLWECHCCHAVTSPFLEEHVLRVLWYSLWSNSNQGIFKAAAFSLLPVLRLEVRSLEHVMLLSGVGISGRNLVTKPNLPVLVAPSKFATTFPITSSLTLLSNFPLHLSASPSSSTSEPVDISLCNICRGQHSLPCSNLASTKRFERSNNNLSFRLASNEVIISS
jgi:hypothetical protein